MHEDKVTVVGVKDIPFSSCLKCCRYTVTVKIEETKMCDNAHFMEIHGCL